MIADEVAEALREVEDLMGESAGPNLQAENWGALHAAIRRYGDLREKAGRAARNCRHPFTETYADGHVACLNCGGTL